MSFFDWELDIQLPDHKYFRDVGNGTSFVLNEKTERDAVIKVTLDSQKTFKLRIGQKYNMKFHRIEVEASRQVVIDLRIGQAGADIDGPGEGLTEIGQINSQVNTKPGSDTFDDYADVNVPHSIGGVTPLIGSAPTPDRTVLLTRVDENAETVRIGSNTVSPTRGQPVPKGAFIKADTSAPLYCSNESGAPVTFSVVVL